jgi:hypothetical protein
MEESMASIHTDIDGMPWAVGTAFCGSAAIFQGEEIVRAKLLSDRRSQGGGSAWLVKFSPPPGKLIKIVATARSDEHVFNLEGGRGTKGGQPLRAAGGYTLNPEGQPHSALISQETISLVVYSGELDEVHSMEIVDIEPAEGTGKWPAIRC